MRTPALASALWLVSCLVSVRAQDHHEFRLLHRLLHPSLDDPHFSERGTLHIAPSGPSFAPAADSGDALEYFLQDAKHDKDTLYQIALERPATDALSEPGLDISSVKACHLQSSTSDYITVHLDSNGSPFSLDYFLSGVPHDGKCPGKSSKASPASLLTNTTVILRFPTFPPLPELRTPPPLVVTPEGQPIQPVPEKTFLQKYWLYITIAVVGVLLTGGEPAAGPRQGSGAQ